MLKSYSFWTYYELFWTAGEVKEEVYGSFSIGYLEQRYAWSELSTPTQAYQPTMKEHLSQ